MYSSPGKDFSASLAKLYKVDTKLVQMIKASLTSLNHLTFLRLATAVDETQI